MATSVYPSIRESDFIGTGGLHVDGRAKPAVSESLVYKLSYYGFGQVKTAHRRLGCDLVRNAEVGNKDVKRAHFEEVFTSEHWLGRIYRVLPAGGRGLSSA